MSHPAVKEAGVGGAPDHARGEKVIAWVAYKSGEQAEPHELLTWCRENLTSYKILSTIIIRDELPKTAVGKILRRALIREYLEGKK